MADKTPSDENATPIPPIVDLTGNGGEPEEKTVARPRKKAEPKVVPPAVPVPPVEAAPTVAAAPAAADPGAQPNPYAASTPPPAPPAPPANPNPYAAPGAPQPYNYGPYVPQPTKTLSIVSMILGIVAVVLAFCYGSGILFGIGAVITGHMASKSQPYAKPMWLTGIITGYASIGIALLWIVGGILFFLAIGAGSYYPYY